MEQLVDGLQLVGFLVVSATILTILVAIAIGIAIFLYLTRSKEGVSDVASRWIVAAGVAVGLLGSQGCAAAGLTLFGVGAGVSTGTGVSYTLDSIAYKTFTAPVEDLQGATLKTLKRMDITVKENKPGESGRKIVAMASDRTIEIELDRLTAKTSRMQVVAKRGWLLRDRATATEIIIQTEQTLDDQALPAHRTIPASAPNISKK